MTNNGSSKFSSNAIFIVSTLAQRANVAVRTTVRSSGERSAIGAALETVLVFTDIVDLPTITWVTMLSFPAARTGIATHGARVLTFTSVRRSDAKDQFGVKHRASGALARHRLTRPRNSRMS